LGVKLGERIGRVQQRHIALGDGASKPQGVVTAATDSGITTASATSIAYGELLDLEHSVDPAYRANARFMGHDDTIKAVKKLMDANGRPLWAAGIAVGAPDTLDGFPLVVNQSMDAIAASKKALLFGDFSKYTIRDVSGLLLTRLNERYAEKGIVAFLLFARSDGALIDAGSHPVKFLTMHS
jgi:HK97 family phage major capsid protein